MSPEPELPLWQRYAEERLALEARAARSARKEFWKTVLFAAALAIVAGVILVVIVVAMVVVASDSSEPCRGPNCEEPNTDYEPDYWRGD